MSNLNYLLIPISFKFNYKGTVIDNSSCGTSYIKGGVAREWAMKALGQDIKIKVRDLDLWINNSDDSSELKHLYLQGEDARIFYNDSIESLMESRDVNINKVLLGREGVYIHIDAYIGIRKKVIWRDCQLKAVKRAIRAHFFALRYGYKVIDGSFIDPYHDYMDCVFRKSMELNLLDKWRNYLMDQLIPSHFIPNDEQIIWEYLYDYNHYFNNEMIRNIISYKEMTWDDWDSYSYCYNLPMVVGKEWVNNSLSVIVNEYGLETIIFINKKLNQLLIENEDGWILYDIKSYSITVHNY